MPCLCPEPGLPMADIEREILSIHCITLHYGGDCAYEIPPGTAGERLFVAIFRRFGFSIISS